MYLWEGYFYLWYELNVGQCTNIMSRGRGHLPYGRLTWMLQVGQKMKNLGRIGSLLISIDIVWKIKCCIDPTLRRPLSQL